MNKNQQIDLPLVFFMIAFVIIILGLFSKFAFQKGLVLKINTVSQAPNTPESTNGNMILKKLNYNNPITCNVISASASVSAQLQGSAVSVVIQQKEKTQKMVVVGDCLYSWIQLEKIGQKKCGVGQYISMGKQLLGSDLATADMMSSAIKQKGQALPIDLGTVLQSCKNVKVIDERVFVLPKGVVFK